MFDEQPSILAGVLALSGEFVGNGEGFLVLQHRLALVFSRGMNIPLDDPDGAVAEDCRQRSQIDPSLGKPGCKGMTEVIEHEIESLEALLLVRLDGSIVPPIETHDVLSRLCRGWKYPRRVLLLGVLFHAPGKDRLAVSRQVERPPRRLGFSLPDMELSSFEVYVCLAEGQDLLRTHTLIPHQPRQIPEILVFRSPQEVVLLFRCGDYVHPDRISIRRNLDVANGILSMPPLLDC